MHTLTNACALSLRSRAITLAEYSERVQLGYAIYNMTVMIMVLLPVSFALKSTDSVRTFLFDFLLSTASHPRSLLHRNTEHTLTYTRTLILAGCLLGAIGGSHFFHARYFSDYGTLSPPISAFTSPLLFYSMRPSVTLAVIKKTPPTLHTHGPVLTHTFLPVQFTPKFLSTYKQVQEKRKSLKNSNGSSALEESRGPGNRRASTKRMSITLGRMAVEMTNISDSSTAEIAEGDEVGAQ
jgi:hypothetical protein